MAVSTDLQYIRQSVRRYSRKPDISNASDAYIDQKINFFGQFILPQHVKLMPLRKVLTFYTAPNIDTYSTEPTDVNDPLYDFKNRYTNIHPPVFFAGIQGFYYQDRAMFYNDWPQINSVANTGFQGNGSQTIFTGNATSAPMLQNSVVFTSRDSSGNPIILTDNPVSSIAGALGLVNQPQALPSPYGDINYLTGAYTVVFPTPPAAGEPIYLENINYQPAKPFAMLFYDNTFTIRPVPDKVYVIELNVDALPTELIAANQSPDIKQWSDVYGLGAALLVFRDDGDLESIQQFQPLFNEALALARRSTLNNSANVRTPSFYQRRNYSGSWFNGSNWPM
jgi:hypothetical protein